MNLGSSDNESKSTQTSESNPLSPDEVKEYYDMINGITSGRMDDFATQGTSHVNYQPLTQAQLMSLGGAGETRRNALNKSLTDQKDQLNNDSSLTVAQRMRGNQLATDSYNRELDAVNKEVESLMSGLASQENANQYKANVRNSDLTKDDLTAIANIFFGGKGQTSKSEGTSKSSGSSWGVGVSI